MSLELASELCNAHLIDGFVRLYYRHDGTYAEDGNQVPREKAASCAGTTSQLGLLGNFADKAQWAEKPVHAHVHVVHTTEKFLRVSAGEGNVHAGSRHLCGLARFLTRCVYLFSSG